MVNREFFHRVQGRQLAVRVLLGILVATLLLAGIQLRSWTWQTTKHVRYQHDLVNGFYWGSQTLSEARKLSPDSESADTWRAFFRGYLALYDRVKKEAYDHDYRLDYPPLRLLAMSIWTKHVREAFPGVKDSRPEHFSSLLKANLLCELASAVGIFLLVRFWVGRAAGATRSRWLNRVPIENRAWICGLMAASAAWFEPSLILDAHGWPQWDAWILPFYLFAAFAASTRRWFWCGCLLAAGTMFKGQLFFVVPFFIFWPLWQRRWDHALQLVAGFAAMAALVVSPWLISTSSAWIALAASFGAIYLTFHVLDLRHVGTSIAGSTAVAVFVIGLFFGGSFSWLQIGFLYGTEHYPYLFISSCYNLPLLLNSCGWSLKDSLWPHELGTRSIGLTLQWALRLLYLLGLAICAWGAARHARKHDPRVLIAIATPWLLMFALLGQMHERYLMWGAVVSAVALGVSVRLTAIHFVISVLSATMIAHVMLVDKKLVATLRLIDLLYQVRPYASILLLFCVSACFWDAISTRGPLFRRRAQESIPEELPALSLQSAGEV